MDVSLDGPIDLTDGWMREGACRSASPELFFPTSTTGLALDVARAKAICAGCAVQARCLDWAVATDQEYGIWGGTTEDERWKLRRDRLTARRRGDKTIVITGLREWDQPQHLRNEARRGSRPAS